MFQAHFRGRNGQSAVVCQAGLHVTTDDANESTGARLATLSRPDDKDMVSVYVCIDSSLFNSFYCKYISKVCAKFYFALIYTFIAIKNSQPPAGLKLDNAANFRCGVILGSL